MTNTLIKKSFFLNTLLKERRALSPFLSSYTFQTLSGFFSSIWNSIPSFKTGKILHYSQWILVAVIVSCIFLPRIPIYVLSDYYQIDLRLDDLLLAVISIIMICYFGYQSGVSNRGDVTAGNFIGRFGTSTERPFLYFLIALQLSMVSGLMLKTIDKPILSYLYLLKWVEYLLVFIAAFYLAAVTRNGARMFMRVFFVLGIVIACYGYWEYFFPQGKAIYPSYYRLYERFPFHGDANHIGGLLVLWICFFSGIMIRSNSKVLTVALFLSLLFAYLPLVWTYSRKSYFALCGGMLFMLLFFKDRRKGLLLFCFFILMGLLLPTRLIERLMDLKETFASPDPFHSSWANNLLVWQQSLWNFDQFFLFGSGVGSRHRLFYESQYILVLAESGLVGFGLFLWLLGSPVRDVILFMRKKVNASNNGIAVGWLVGFVGLLIHNLSCVSWTVTKIAIPFWFLTGAVLAYLKSSHQDHAKHTV